MQRQEPCILIVDDDKSSRKVLYELLKSYARIILAKNGAQAIDSALKHQPSLILLDVVMPDKNGFEILEQIKGDERTRNISVIFITARNSYTDETRGFKLGACDYIRKPFHYEIVKARVSTHLELAQKRHLLEELANLDALTSIPNRRHLEQSIRRLWSKAIESEKTIAIGMLDVDHFKSYNDEYGHAAGDSVLRQVANTIDNQLNRPNELVCRYGGEEFCVLLPNTNQERAHQTLRDCCTAVEDLQIEHKKAPVHGVVTVSIGTCICQPSQGDTYENALVMADHSLYQSKKNGRNQVSIT